MNFLVRVLLVLALLVPSQFASAQFSDQRTWAPTTGGSANAQTVAIPNVSGPPLGVVFRFVPQFTNSGAATLNINGTGAKNVYKPSPAGPSPLTGGELVAGQIVAAMFDGTNYQLISNLDATASQIVPNPGGYLTPCTQVGTPTTGCSPNVTLPTGDVTSVTTLFYTPVASGAQIPIWNGTQYVPFTFSELVLSLGSGNLANTIYDVCVFNNSGVPTVVTSVAWSSSAPGSSSRGTGAGTAQIVRTNGFWTNAVDITGRNGANTYSISANRCTIIGSILVDGTNGQLSFLTSVGVSRKWSVSNIYNQQTINLVVEDPNTSWNLPKNMANFRPANNNSSNNITILSSIPDQIVSVRYDNSGYCYINAASGASQIPCAWYNGIGLNSTSSPQGKFSESMILLGNIATGGSVEVGAKQQNKSILDIAPFAGSNVVYALESSGNSGSQASITIYGTWQMWFRASWRG